MLLCITCLIQFGVSLSIDSIYETQRRLTLLLDDLVSDRIG